MNDDDNLRPAPIPYLDPDPNGPQAHVIDRDTRIRINPTTSQPYRWICFIKLHLGPGFTPVHGSGFLVRIPGSNTGCILTAGHVLWLMNDDTGTYMYPESLEIFFPGKDPIRISEPDSVTIRERYFVSRQYKENLDRNYDFGAIALPGYQGRGFGYTAVVTDDTIRASTAVVFGYPGDKRPRGQMWGSGSKFLDPSQHHPDRLYYDLDTYGGQSGSPVYIWYDGFWTVVGIHVAGNRTSNFATRLTPRVLKEVLLWLQHPLHKVTLRKWNTGDYRMIKIPTHVAREFPAGSGRVIARYSRDAFCDLTLIPLEYIPQGTTFPSPDTSGSQEVKYAIASFRFPNTYVRMMGRQLAGNRIRGISGGGQVNCQFTVKKYEMFRIKKDEEGVPDTINIESVEDPGVFLRMDSRNVNASTQDGPVGSVNAQWGASDPERFQQFVNNDTPEQPDVDVVDPAVRAQIDDLKEQVTDRDAKIQQLQAQLNQAKADLAAFQCDPPSMSAKEMIRKLQNDCDLDDIRNGSDGLTIAFPDVFATNDRLGSSTGFAMRKALEQSTDVGYILAHYASRFRPAFPPISERPAGSWPCVIWMKWSSTGSADDWYNRYLNLSSAEQVFNTMYYA